MRKLQALLDPVLVTLFLCWSIWSYHMAFDTHPCVIERNVVQLGVNGRPQTVRVDVVGKGRYQ